MDQERMTMRKYNGFPIKLFMAVLMVLDHLEKIPGLVSFEWAGIFHGVTRCIHGGGGILPYRSICGALQRLLIG